MTTGDVLLYATVSVLAFSIASVVTALIGLLVVIALDKRSKN